MRQFISADHRAHLREYWLNVRRVRFWVVILLLLYTLAGFLGLPWLLRTQAIETLATEYDRDLRIEQVRVNPYALTLEVDKLELDDRDGERIVRFDRLIVDFTLASLFNRAWTFETVALEGLSIRAERFESGRTRLGRLAAEFAAEPPDGGAETPDEPEDGALPRIVIERLRLASGALRFTDHVPPETFRVAVDPINIEIDGIDTRPQREGTQSVRMQFASGGTLDWQGTLQLAPFRAEGRIAFDDVVADGLLPYVQQFMPLRDLQLVFDASLAYRAALAPDGLQLTVDDIGAEFRRLALSAFEPETEFLAADAIRVESGSYRHAGRAIDVGAIRIERPRVRTWLTPAGRPGLLALLPEDTGGEAEAEPADAPFSFELAELRVNGLDVDLADRSTSPPAPIGLRGVDLAVDGFDLEPGTRFATRLSGRLASGGRVAFDGGTRIAPAFSLDGDLQVDALALELAEPYLARVARARFAGGTLALDGRLAIGPEEPLAYEGRAAVDNLDLVTADGGDRVLGWQSLRMDALALGLGERRVETSLISIEQPFANVAIAEDQSTNIGRLLVDSPDGDASENGTGDTGPFSVTVDGIAVTGGAMDFSDRSLPLPFATRVEGLGGRVSTLASGSAEPAGIALEGQVGEFGLARIDGTINTWQPVRHTDIRLEFRNLEMPDYSPYTVQFAGRRIANGRMDLDLAYRIDEGRLEGSNDIVLRDLQLGEKVDNPDAADLPLGLAVALLKDSNGVIDVDLPVSGDVNDPQFEMGGVIRQALVALITKIVTSPFTLLGSLVGIESEDFGRIEFLAGRSDLTPPQREKIAKLVEALGKRPQLALEIAGAWDPRLDRPALQRARTLERVRERLGLDAEDDEGRALTLSDEAARKPLRELFREAYPDTDLDTVREPFVQPPEDDPEGEPELDAVAFHAHLARRVAAAQEIGEGELEALASARVEAVRKALLAGQGAGEGGLQAGRVRVGEPTAVDGEGGERVPLEIELATE